ncbi:MAG: alpha/beta fold hydrolase [Alphaproteobacteria bacterium]
MSVFWATGRPLRIAAGGASLEARCSGPPPGEAPTLVLLHEGLGSVALWRDFPDALAAATCCGVFAYSRQGYGASDPCPLPRPLDYMTDEAVRVLPQVLDAVGLVRGVLVGHSDGASIAALNAGLVGDPRIAGIVLMAPHFFTEPMGLAAIAAARAAYEAGPLRDRLARYHADVDTAFHGWNDAWLDPGFVSWDIRAPLAGINVPVLAIQGEDDQYGTAAQLQAVETAVPVSVTLAMLPDCRHAPFVDQPERTLALIRAFVGGL